MDDHASPDEALKNDTTFSNAAATAPRLRPAEQTGFGSGVAASAPRNDSGQLGSRRTPGTTSSSSTRSSKRLRGSPARCPPGSYLDGSSIYTNSRYPHRGEGKQSNRAQWTREMSGDRRSGGRGRRRKRSAGGRPKNITTPSVEDSSREGASSAGRDNSLSGEPSSRAGPAGRTPASAVQPPSSRGFSSAGAAAIHPVRRSSRTNVAFGDTSSRAGPTGCTPASAVQPDHDGEAEDLSNQLYRRQSVLLAASAQSTRRTLHDDRQHQQRATNANHPRVRSAGMASGLTQPAAQTNAASRQEQPPRLYSIKRTKKKKQPQPKQGWNKGVSPDAVW